MIKVIRNAALLITAIGLSVSAIAQQGAITDEMLEKYKTDLEENAKIEMLQNAVTHNKISDLAHNYDNYRSYDKHFSDRVKSSGITDQHSSGRCWLFTGLNVLRAGVISQYEIDGFEFSQTYNFFFDQLEKSNLYLEGIIETADKPMDDKKVEWLFKNVIGDGGQWTGVVDIVSKYGVVPASVMPETDQSKNTGWTSKLIRRILKADALELRAMQADGKSVKKMREAKTEMLSEIYKMLSISLGEPPVEFTWRYKDKEGNLTELKKYTPQSFYKEFVNVNLDDYVMFMNDPSRPFNKLYEIDYDRHTFDGNNWKYINLDVEKIKPIAIASIQGDEGMYFSCDVGKQLDSKAGILDTENYLYGSVFDVEYTMDKKQRIETFESGSSHGMALMAVDLDEAGSPKKWLLENSWGAESGFKGNLIMTDRWFDEYMFRVVINKKYIPQDILKILDEEPTFLPPWDPMFSEDK